MAPPSKHAWLSKAHRRLLVHLAGVKLDGKWKSCPEMCEYIIEGDGLELSLYVTAAGKPIVCVAWQADEARGQHLAAEVKRRLDESSSRKWRLGRKSWNRIYIE
jgi:hypothetical protein